MTDQQAKVVQEILAAKTLYDVLGVSPQTMEKSALRKAYLTTSVKVHPDKNTHPRATEAFQRVAEAWNTLSDSSARADYDAELRNGRRTDRYGRTPQTQYAYDFERAHMPSFQEALFMFATATSMFSAATSSGGGGGAAAANASRGGSATNAATDFMETIFWAQKLAEDRNQPQSTTRGGGDPNNNPQNNRSASEVAADDPLASGMALGSGLKALAKAQRAMGMKKSATATEKAASTVQMAAMGAAAMKAANENPAVKRTLERGQTALKDNPQISKGIRASLKIAGSLVSALHEAQKESQQQQQQQNSGGGGSSRR